MNSETALVEIEPPEKYIRVSDKETDTIIHIPITSYEDPIPSKAIQKFFPKKRSMIYVGEDGKLIAVDSTDNCFITPPGGWGKRHYFFFDKRYKPKDADSKPITVDAKSLPSKKENESLEKKTFCIFKKEFLERKTSIVRAYRIFCLLVVMLCLSFLLAVMSTTMLVARLSKMLANVQMIQLMKHGAIFRPDKSTDAFHFDNSTYFNGTSNMNLGLLELIDFTCNFCPCI